MQKAIIKIRITAYVLLYSAIVSAQEPQLSQFYASPVFTNPAFAGSERKLRIVGSVRNQYTALKNSFKTSVFSIDGYSQKFNGGLGLLACFDVAGDGLLRTINLSGIYSYNMSVNRDWSVNASLQGSIIQRSYDATKLRFGDQLNEFAGYTGLPSGDLKNMNVQGRVFSNFSSGFLAYSDNFYGGIAVHNLFEPNQSLMDNNYNNSQVLLRRRYTVHSGLNLYLSRSRYKIDKMILSPNILFMQQQSFYQVNLGMYFKNKALTIGSWLRQTSRNSDAIIILVGLKLPAFRVGYSYDATISKSRTSMGGSHELSMAFQIKINTKTPIHRSKYIKCPDL
ncbi:MAG: PorP/SprF family type IX secretion system membrane protein [Bacteroidota bacterium]|nr:PorP/SprF family type IX secretion system membrane protein [Bacteroidota bacterium]